MHRPSSSRLRILFNLFYNTKGKRRPEANNGSSSAKQAFKDCSIPHVAYCGCSANNLKPMLQGLKILPYLDDWIVCAPSREQAINDSRIPLRHVQAHSKQRGKQSDTLTKVHKIGIGLPNYDGLITTGSCSDNPYVNQETETRVAQANLTVSTGTTYDSSKCGSVREASCQTFTDVADCSVFRPCTSQSFSSAYLSRMLSYSSEVIPMEQLPSIKEVIKADAVWRHRGIRGELSMQRT